MAAGSRRVVWSESAKRALDEVLVDIAEDSADGAIRVLTATLELADSLSSFAERGRIVPELADPNLREVFVFDYRLMYRVHQDRVTIAAFLHGARDFARWSAQAKPDL